MNARTLGWIGYDWFKLLVTIILILLLIWFSYAASGAPATSVPRALRWSCRRARPCRPAR